MSDQNVPTDVKSELPPELIAEVADFQQELVSLCANSKLPFQFILELLLTTASTIVIHQKCSRAQFMELARIVFTKVQTFNKQGLIQDTASPPAGPSIIMPGK